MKGSKMETCDKCGSKVEEKLIKLDTFTYGLLLGALGEKVRYVTVTEKDGSVVTGFFLAARPFAIYICDQ